MSDALSLHRPHDLDRTVRHRRVHAGESREAARARAQSLIKQADAALANGGSGIDITDVPVDELLAQFRRLGWVV
jgi:hypothetical protein